MREIDCILGEGGGGESYWEIEFYVIVGIVLVVGEIVVYIGIIGEG